MLVISKVWVSTPSNSTFLSRHQFVIPQINSILILPCCRVSQVQLCTTLWGVACQAPQSLGFSRQKYWSGLPFPSLGDLPNPGIKPTSLKPPALAGGFFITSATQEAQF